MTFNEANSVRDFVRDILSKTDWRYVPSPDLPRKEDNVLVEEYLIDALKRINPEIREKFKP